MDVFPANESEYAKELELAPRKARGWVHEVEAPMRTGDTIRYTSHHEGAGERVTFNVHSHQGKDITYHAKTSQASVAGAFTAPWAGKFYLMWENGSDGPVLVRIHAARLEVYAEPAAEGVGRHHE